PEVNLSAGASWKNLGEDLDYTRLRKAPLPRVFVRGMGGSAGLTLRTPVNLNFFRFTMSRDVYKPRIGGKIVDPRCNDDMDGWEYSLLETVSFRRGSFDDRDGDRHYTTSGMTLSSEGLFTAITLLRAKSEKMNYIDYILQNSSIAWTRFKYKGGVHDGMHHSQVSMQFHLQ
ncbi:MAG TPA: hypothetical protein VHR86_01050, partial [Armatimonadota bacterium]|nr:hypothetical protein [Armatimonadota bacterium]